MTNKYTLTYFNVRGRGEPIRLLLEDAGIHYEDVRSFDWKIEKQNRDKYVFGQLPCLTVGDWHLVQGDAIIRFLAREHGYYGSNTKEAAIIDMLSGAIGDILTPYLKVVYGGNFETDLVDFMANKVPSWSSCMELFIKKYGKDYPTGDKPSFADFQLYEVCQVLSYLDDQFLQKYPFFSTFIEKMESRPRLSAYLNSGRRPLRVNANNFGTPQKHLDMLNN